MNNPAFCRPVINRMRMAFSVRRGGLILVWMLWVFAGAVQAADHYVTPAGGYGTNNPPYANWADAATNIQDAVNVATNGETVWLTNGTYYCGSNSATAGYTSMVVVTKTITIQSVNGPAVTIVDANYPGFTNRCFYISSNATLAGLTITNGHTSDAASGGGVVIKTSGRLTNCWITGNSTINGIVSTYTGGGGLYCEAGAEVLNCMIYANSGSNASGLGAGGVLAYSPVGISDYRFRDCVISNNSTLPSGGAVYFYQFTGFIMSNCTIISNQGGGLFEYTGYACSWTVDTCRVIGNTGGIGLYMVYGNGIARNCQIYNNTKGGVYVGTGIGGGGVLSNCVVSGNSGGPGITFGGNLALVQDCTIVSNSGDTAGGAYFGAYGGILRNCLIASNSATYGAGIYMTVSTAGHTGRVENCTIVNNAGVIGGGIRIVTGAGTGVVINTIIYSNTAAAGPNWQMYDINDTSKTFINCCTTPTNAGTGGILPGFNNITNAPLFVDYAGFNFRLNPSSPCINAGTNQTWMDGANDLDGRRRINRYYGNIVDIGAYEYAPALTIYEVH